jgi:L-alanine-DL-glutamate epimerase-like enolase superfamily enzyme
MRIERVSLFQKTLPLATPYRLSGGRLLFEELDSTFVRIETANGITGWGEGCPWGHTYLPAHGAGIRAAAELLAPALIGMDPRQIEHINDKMDLTLPGHLYAKSPFDIACWDLFGQATNLPIADLLGGCHEESTPIASSISTGTPEEMLALVQEYRDLGYYTHSVKIGADTELDVERIRYLEQNRNNGEFIIYDLNRAWLPAEAIQVMNNLSDLPVVFEQPCETLDQCAIVRARTTHPISIDERLETTQDMQRIINEGIGEIVNIKIGRVGGLSRARKIRDIGLAAGIKFLIMETGGSVIADTATQHFAQSIPRHCRIGTWLCQEMITVDTAPGLGSRNLNGDSCIPNGATGLGVAPDESILGRPVAVYE